MSWSDVQTQEDAIEWDGEITASEYHGMLLDGEHDRLESMLPEAGEWNE